MNSTRKVIKQNIFLLLQEIFRSALILGHSFVRRLKDELEKEYVGEVGMFECNVASHLTVSRSIPLVYLFGSGPLLHGMLIPSILIRNLSPQVLILDYGSNELASGVLPEQLICEIVQKARQILAEYTCIKVIGLLSIVPRAAGFRSVGVNEDVFLERAFQVNKALKQICKNMPNIIFTRQKGFYEKEIKGKKFKLEVKEWSDDLIHPDRPESRETYENSLRLALCDTLRWAAK